jgi:hypothetical protein
MLRGPFVNDFPMRNSAMRNSAKIGHMHQPGPAVLLICGGNILEGKATRASCLCGDTVSDDQVNVLQLGRVETHSRSGLGLWLPCSGGIAGIRPNSAGRSDSVQMGPVLTGRAAKLGITLPPEWGIILHKHKTEGPRWWENDNVG